MAKNAHGARWPTHDVCALADGDPTNSSKYGCLNLVAGKSSHQLPGGIQHHLDSNGGRQVVSGGASGKDVKWHQRLRAPRIASAPVDVGVACDRE
jgi:hypothetical protein